MRNSHCHTCGDCVKEGKCNRCAFRVSLKRVIESTERMNAMFERMSVEAMSNRGGPKPGEFIEAPKSKQAKRGLMAWLSLNKEKIGSES
jgi:hypothetical protein